MAKLNAKQQRFCDEYLIDLNATQAAIRSGYSEKTAYSQGQRMLKNVEVKAYIDAELEKAQALDKADSGEVRVRVLRVTYKPEQAKLMAKFFKENNISFEFINTDF